MKTWQIPFANDGKIKEKLLMIQKWKKLITKKQYSKLTKNSNVKIKQKSDGKIYLSSRCIDCGFKMFETIDKEGLNGLLKIWTIYKAMLWYCLTCRTKTESENPKVVKTI